MVCGDWKRNESVAFCFEIFGAVNINLKLPLIEIFTKLVSLPFFKYAFPTSTLTETADLVSILTIGKTLALARVHNSLHMQGCPDRAKTSRSFRCL